MRKLFLTFLFVMMAAVLPAQIPDAFREPVIKKVNNVDREVFLKRFENMQLTGQGLDGITVIDNIPTTEIRARLQSLFGDPTQTLDDFIGRTDLRPGNSVQFEYWFIIDDEIPMMILDIDGPFSAGLVFGGASRHVDLMPQIKRTFSENLMKVDRLAPYQDYFFSPERDEWYLVQYQEGRFESKKTDVPAKYRNMKLN